MKSAESSARVLRFPRSPAARASHELEFLPAALEIVETPPSPAGRAIAATLILFFAAAVAWASFSQIDIISTSTGKIVPTGRVKVIQPFDTGVVRMVHVKDGDAVKAGDVLVELDPTIDAAEAGRIRAQLLASDLDVARLRALLSDAGNPVAAFIPPAAASAAQTDIQRTLLANQLQEIQAKLASLDRQIAQNEASRAGSSTQVEKLKQSIPLLKQRVDIFKDLFDKGWGQKPQYLDLAQQLIEHQQDLQAQNEKVKETTAAIAALQEQRRQAEAEFRRTNLSDLADAEQKAAAFREQLAGAQQRQKLQTLTAPVNGTVQQLAVHTVGGVVTPAQQLMVIVPADSRLEIEAMVPNRDIGFIREGDPADIKIDTFNFTRYGLVHGKVASVSQDAITRQSPAAADQRNAASPKGNVDESSEPKGQELVYAARVALDQTRMQIDDRLVNLAPGMAVTVEIKTGRRRVIEYLLSPLLRYRQDALKER
jgi:membrane fusion protein, hemolysin D